MKRIYFFYKTQIAVPALLFLSFTGLFSLTLKNGPMLSDLTYREAQIWVQSTKPSSIVIHYYEKNNPAEKYITEKIYTTEVNGCTANFSLGKIEPNRSYSYSIEIDGILSSEKYTFNSLDYYHYKEPPPDIKIAVLGPHYGIDPEFEPPYRNLGGGYSIFQKVFDSKPDLVLWAGNTAHLRKSDIGSQLGYFKRYSHARSLIKPKKLLAEIPNLGIWSFNDYGVASSGSEMSLKHSAKLAFCSFWPKASLVKHQKSLCYSHKISDIEFFFLDSQSEKKIKSYKSSNSAIFGQEQIEWLKNALLASSANFKVIVSGAPILNPSKSEKNLSFAEYEKEKLLGILKNYKISGLLFISGGAYKGELTRLGHSTHYDYYDLTVGPSTAMPLLEDNELNFFRVPGTNTLEQQYAILEIKGNEGNRFLNMHIYSLAGLKLWSRTIRASELVPTE